jgi:phosphoglucomutase/phosphomannomutase
MSETIPMTIDKQHLKAIETALAAQKITAAAVENLKIWLTEPRYSAYFDQIVEHIEAGKWQQLDDVFWTIIPFGTGGRRGMMYPFGSNAINTRTIGESAQGLADYVKEVKPQGPWSMAIAYDTRHRSREFAELCTGIMVANGFEVYFLDAYRSTPQLSLLTRYKQCDCGIMVTASHNPPSDNAVKVYWSTGAQLIPPHDANVIEKVNQVEEIPCTDFSTAVKEGKVHLVLTEIDDALRNAEAKYSFPGPRDLKVIFSPLHGVSEFNVKPLLNEVGFDDLEIYEPHREPSPDFPNVPGNVSNPENKEVFTAIIAHAKTQKAELILASDPDGDRMGAAVPMTLDPTGQWSTLNGNQLGVLLADFVLRQRQSNGTLSSENYLITTLVTTTMLNRVAEFYGVKCYNENLVGFKWICSLMDQLGAHNMAFATEESHGFLVGDYCRDKDGAVACMLMAELAAWVKSQGKSMFEHLDDLYRQHGLHYEVVVNIGMKGSDGMARMKTLMQKFRDEPPQQLGGLKVVGVRDYSVGKQILAGGKSESITGPTGDLLIFETEKPGNYVAARPSGTEPKIKFYLFAMVPPNEIGDLATAKIDMETRAKRYAEDMQAFADAV